MSSAGADKAPSSMLSHGAAAGPVALLNEAKGSLGRAVSDKIAENDGLLTENMVSFVDFIWYTVREYTDR